ncbi:Uncharacterized protein conserved in archaea [Geoglobus ahangari]|uniref:Uncharacterized protein conserved in archaea n=1 Tax=Geoglobus ahangari TaxID=113653 RepID=A0A0F7IG65_9EURY|nr:DUF1786 family protein [Geoglobus ahangari]AKG92190.1 Uncharacterized protein conserved in archaea [Geoglobus ahangari]
MEIFTLDVGTGTQDFLLYIEGENVRNCPKSVMPSPTKVVAKRVREIADAGRNILLTGYTMGGGPSSRAIREAASKVRVYAYEKPALTINDDLDRVRAEGVTIVDERPEDENLVEIELGDVDLDAYSSMLSSFGMNLPDRLVISVQDHGFSPEESNRRFRFRMFERVLKESPYLDSFLYPAEKIPEHYNRMMAVAEAVRDYGDRVGRDFELYVIDTVFSAIAGAMLDAREFPALVMNFGNGHTVFAIVDRDGRIYALMEHHTSIVRRMDINRLVGQFIRGELTNDAVYEQGGHGAYIDSVVEVRDFVATGPNAQLSDFREANPVGDVMIVGNVGMVSLLRSHELFDVAGV